MIDLDITWAYTLKKKILLGVFAILAAAMFGTMIYASYALESHLLADSRQKTSEISSTISASLKGLMLKRAPEAIEASVTALGNSGGSINGVLILDRTGRAIHSSRPGLSGETMDRFADASCNVCHESKDSPPGSRSAIIEKGEIQRNIEVIYNEPSCHGCHPPEQRINGKLIIDRSLSGTYALIAYLRYLLFASGLVALAVSFPLLKKGIDRYVNMIISQHNELGLLYVIVERLSKTLDLNELKQIVVELIRDAFKTDEVYLILFGRNKGLHAFLWERGSAKPSRYRVGKDLPFYETVLRWKEGEAEDVVLERGGYVLMPLISGRTPLVFFALLKTEPRMPDDRMRLLRAMTNHVTIAFENSRLYSLAITDELTGLYTYRHFKYYLNKKFSDHEKHGEKLALIMIDIDDFKKVNDTYGHIAGDKALAAVAVIMLLTVRNTTDVCFRYGGEEFCILMSASGMRAGEAVAERLRAAIERKEIKVEGRSPIRLTISVGVSACPEIAGTAKDLALSADRALLKAKSGGKNRVIRARPAAGPPSTEAPV